MDYMDSVKTIGVLCLIPLITMISYKVLKNTDKEEFNKIKIYRFISSFFLWFIPSTYVNYIDRDKTMSFQRIAVLIIFALIFSTIITNMYVFTRRKWNVKIKE
jgi:predicted membrane channel-forming protein YqfA (hemolysin III family)